MKRWEIYLEILMEIVLIVGLMFVIGFVLPKTLAFLWPLVAGWIIAVMAHPLHRFLQKKLKISKKMGSACIVILVIALVSGLLYVVGAKLVRETIAFANGVPGIYQEVENNVLKLWDSIDDMLPGAVGEKVMSITSKLTKEITSYSTSDKGAEYIGSVAHSLTNGIIGIIVMFMSAYFFIADWDKIHKQMKEVLDEKVKDNVTLIKDNMLGAVGGYFLAQLKLMGIVFALLLVGFFVLRVDCYFGCAAIFRSRYCIGSLGDI